MKVKVALHNLGCKVNAYELEAMEQMLKNAGYEVVPFAPGADIYIIIRSHYLRTMQFVCMWITIIIKNIMWILMKFYQR